MQAIMETVFDVLYLGTVTFIGLQMVIGSKNSKFFRWFGIMTLILGFGDAFHLIPRVIALWGEGIEAHTVSLGFGKLVTSFTMTIFYVILYHIWHMFYNVRTTKVLTLSIYSLAFIRIALLFFPQNDWFSADAPLIWGIYRNIPFAILGILIIVLFYHEAKEMNDKVFKYMWLAIVISFGFYIPVVLWADTYPLVGILMIPKTCAYVWMVWMGYREFKK